MSVILNSKEQYEHFSDQRQTKYFSDVVDMLIITGSLSNQCRTVLIFSPEAKRTLLSVVETEFVEMELNNY